MSALIPGLFAIVQSIGVHEHCPATNHTNGTVGTSTKLKPLFSVSVYFVLIMILLIICTLSFSFLNYSKYVRRARKSAHLGESLTQSDLTKILASQKIKMISLFTMTFIGSFFMYGYLPGLISYSNLPYGNIFFHLSINLSKTCLIY